jgi:iron complex transport system substrate-binding protein
MPKWEEQPWFMRIVSLLPSLTELVCALGRRGELVGVTHECDYPPDVAKLPHLTRSRIPRAATSGEIDALVSDHAGSLYELDEDLLADLKPDLILTQEQCDVCAVNEATVRRSAQRLAGRPDVESVNPTTLVEVMAMFRRIGFLLGTAIAADDLMARFEATTREIARRQSAVRSVHDAPSRRRVLLLEWLDPPFSSGHWNPEIIHLAGGTEALGKSGRQSRRCTWEDVATSQPEVIIVSPCGFALDRTVAEVASCGDRPEWRNLSAVKTNRVVVVDGSAYFSRPGPRLEASLRIAAAAIDPEACADLAPDEGEGWQFWPGTG